MARFTTDYEAHPYVAREITISTTINSESTLVDPLTHQAVRITYWA